MIPEARRSRPAAGLFFKFNVSLQLGYVFQCHILTGMTHPGRRTQHHRRIERLGNLIGLCHHLFGLAGCVRIENRNSGHHSHQAAVLFRLR